MYRFSWSFPISLQTRFYLRLVFIKSTSFTLSYSTLCISGPNCAPKQLLMYFIIQNVATSLRWDMLETHIILATTYQASHTAQFLQYLFFQVFGNVFCVSFKGKHFSLLPYRLFSHYFSHFSTAGRTSVSPMVYFLHILVLHKKAQERLLKMKVLNWVSLDFID